MKIFIFTIIFFTLFTGITFAQEFPIAGKWKMQTIGTPDELFLEMNHNIWTFEFGGNNLIQNVVIDNDKKTIIIPFLAIIADYYYFEINDSNIDLRAGGKFNMPLLEMMSESFNDLQGINDISDNFIEKIKTELEIVFFSTPIIRLYRE